MKLKSMMILGMVAGVGFYGVAAASDTSSEPFSDGVFFEGESARPQSVMSDSAEGGIEDDRIADVANAISPPPPGTTGTRRSLRLAGSVFKPRNSNVDYHAVGAGGCIEATSSPITVFTAPVTLPQGAAVEYVRMYAKDTNSTEDTAGWFTVYDLNGNVEVEYLITSSGSSGDGYWTTDKIDPPHYINYSTYSYVLNWRPNASDGSIALCGFRLYYYMPSLVR